MTQCVILKDNLVAYRTRALTSMNWNREGCNGTAMAVWDLEYSVWTSRSTQRCW